MSFAYLSLTDSRRSNIDHRGYLPIAEVMENLNHMAAFRIGLCLSGPITSGRIAGRFGMLE
jgi:hypothetical protein